MGKEGSRKIVHISMAGWALLIGRVPPVYIVLLAMAALLFNIFLLPRITARSLERESDIRRGFSLGMLSYPAIVLFLSLLFFHRQIFLAIGWGAMAFGDGFATVVGTRWGKKKIGRGTKSWAGSLAFVLPGSLFTALLLLLLPEDTKAGLPFAVWSAVLFMALLAAAFVEALPGMIDDNIIVPVVAALTAWLMVELYLGGTWVLPQNWLPGLMVVILLTVLSYLTRRFTISGALTGGFVSFLVFLGAGFPGLLLLFLFVIPGSLSSSLKYKYKLEMGLAQENKGKRNPWHVLSNGAVAALCGLLAWQFPSGAGLYTGMLAASLSSALADTISSEVGNAYGSGFINIITWRSEARGLDGVISPGGTMAGVAAALFFSAGYALLYGFGWPAACIFLCGSAGMLVDSMLGATLQRANYMNNHTVNLFSTVFSALLFLVIS